MDQWSQYAAVDICRSNICAYLGIIHLKNVSFPRLLCYADLQINTVK